MTRVFVFCPIKKSRKKGCIMILTCTLIACLCISATVAFLPLSGFVAGVGLSALCLRVVGLGLRDRPELFHKRTRNALCFYILKTVLNKVKYCLFCLNEERRHFPINRIRPIFLKTFVYVLLTFNTCVRKIVLFYFPKKKNAML